MSPTTDNSSTSSRVAGVLNNFTRWLDSYGETSWDHQSYFAGPIGRRAKRLYYKNKALGTLAVAPMIFSEALLPGARRLFHHRIRFPIADAHYAMGFGCLYQATGEAAHLERAIHFLDALQQSRSPGFKEYCWGYPFDWVTRNGTLKESTPFITTTPYVFEAFLQVSQLAATLQPSRSSHYSEILASIVRHATTDIKDQPFPDGGRTCSYMPQGEFNVVNASAYRATLLVSAANHFHNDDWLKIAAGNVDFVLAAQNSDGSWPYAKDGVRDFVDHFHTCFVMKALAKIYLNLQGTERGGQSADIAGRIFAALKRGVEYYRANLFSEDGMPRPFAKKPRLTVYQCELYDCAESINLCLLLRQDFPQLEETLSNVVTGILRDWTKPDGSFRSRRLLLGWDNVPMHRWAQSQMFRALALYLRESRVGQRAKG